MEHSYTVPVDDKFGAREIAISLLKHNDAPGNPERSTCVAIVCHGMFCNMSTAGLIPSLAGFLSERWCVCRMDFAGNGQSSGEWSYALYDRDVADLDAVCAYLEASLGLKTVLIAGHSKGGAVTILHGAFGGHGRECLHVSVAGRVGYDPASCEKRFTQEEKEAIRRDGHITKTMYRKEWLITQGAIDERSVLGVKIAKALQTIECPLFHIHGTADTVVSPTDADIVKENAKKSAIEYVEGADHLFRGKESILAWKINKWIEATSPSQQQQQQE